MTGAGKTTLAKSIGGYHYEADQYFTDENGVYSFDFSRIKLAHESCKLNTVAAMQSNAPRIVVSNTFTQEWEMQSYLDMAKDFGYVVYSLIVENRHGGKNSHNVPQESLDKMKQRFEVKL